MPVLRGIITLIANVLKIIVSHIIHDSATCRSIQKVVSYFQSRQYQQSYTLQ